MNEKVFESAAALVAKGIPVVPVWGVRDDGTCACPKGGDCAAPGKHPIGAGWQHSALLDEEAIYNILVEEATGPRNIGILLGPKSGLIDIEHDTEEGKATAARLGLFHCGTPAFKSSRSTHYLFKYDPRLPMKAVIPNLQGLEIRLGADGRGAQSIAPGSTHHSGVVYTWHDGRSIDELDVQPMPRELFEMIEQSAGAVRSSGTDLTVAVEPVEHGGRHDAIRRLAMQLAGAAKTELTPKEQNTIYAAAMAINSTLCKPPLPDNEVKVLMHSAFAVVARTRAEKPNATSDEMEIDFVDRWSQVDSGADISVVTNSAEENTLISTGLELRDDGWWPGRWRMEVIEGDPRRYVLIIPCQLADPDRGEFTREVLVRIELSSSDINKPDIVASAILEATGTMDVCPYPGLFATVWLGKKPKKGEQPEPGLKTRLISTEKKIAGSYGEFRYAAAAQWFVDTLNSADPEAVYERPERDGMPAWIEGEGLAFKWETVITVVKERNRTISDDDITSMRKAIERALGGKIESRRLYANGGGRLRFLVVDQAQLDKLNEMVDSLG